MWARLRVLARQDGSPISVRHACLVCAEVVDAEGAGVSLTDGSSTGEPGEPVFATDERSRELEELQFTLGQGPAVDALAQGRLVVAANLTGTETRLRWPVFAPEAARRGVRSMVAVPIQAGDVRLGALDCYRELAGLPTRQALIEAVACADAALILAFEELGEPDQSLNGLFAGDFGEYRAQVHQAAGMVSVQLDIGTAEALVRLRAHSYAQDRPLSEVAADVVARRLRFGPSP